jgi:hypothetical protein
VQDYAKSRKHEWVEACFIPDLTETDAVGRVVERFVTTDMARREDGV